MKIKVPMGGANAPIYVSTDGGDTWSLNNIVPSAGSLGTGDITLRFAGTSGRMFASILDGSTGAFEVHRTTNFTSPAAMTQLESRANEDQPYTQAATVMGGADVGKDRVYIGVNDFNAAGGKTATVEQSLDAGMAAPAFASDRVETRSTLGQDGPQIRPAIHPDGTIYAAFYRWITSSGSFPANTLVITNAEVIVVRDDAWGTVAPRFAALTDTSDGLAGRRVATGLSFPFNRTGVAANGQERWGGDLSIAVDLRNSATVYLVFATLVSGVSDLFALHRRLPAHDGPRKRFLWCVQREQHAGSGKFSSGCHVPAEPQFRHKETLCARRCDGGQPVHRPVLRQNHRVRHEHAFRFLRSGLDRYCCRTRYGSGTIH